VTSRFVLGVTGGIATGKSAVLAMLRDRGFETIDGDFVYHALIAPGGSLVDPLVTQFGDSIRAADGSIDRRALGAIVFSDPEALAELDRITHPAVLEAIRDLIAHSTEPMIAIDAVKLIEAGIADLCDAVWLVVANPAVQVERLMTRNGIDRDEAERRVASQPDEQVRRARADLVIDNSGSIDELTRLVTNALDSTLPKV
jgi:dephospho-CoA kinase